MIEIAQAILAAQKEMGNAKKGAQNPFFKSKYADLNSIREACLPALHKNGISVLQPTVTIDGVHYVKTVLLHTTGQMFDSLTQIVFAKQNEAQAQGSGITYARRYGLQSLLCIGADDDDGNGAAKPEKTLNSVVRITIMNVLKFILFIEFIAMFVCGSMHLILFFSRQKFPLEMYPLIAVIVLICCLLTIYVFAPLGEWFLG